MTDETEIDWGEVQKGERLDAALDGRLKKFGRQHRDIDSRATRQAVGVERDALAVWAKEQGRWSSEQIDRRIGEAIEAAKREGA